MKELEIEIRQKLLPAILGGNDVTDHMQIIYSLSARSGGLGIQNPEKDANFEYQNSVMTTKQLTDAIYRQDNLLIDEEEQSRFRSEVIRRKTERCRNLEKYLNENIPARDFKMLELASEKGASIWFTTLPLKE